jgi:23S rRNA-/tRNA-specific pseudouridylate synthase
VTAAQSKLSPEPRILKDLGDGVIAIDKPAGWLVHAGAEGQDSPIIGDWLEVQLAAQLTAQPGTGERPAPFKPAPVHRLDLETSGIVLFATTGEAAGRMGKLFTDHGVAKTYVAIVHGRCRKKGIIRTKLRQDGKSVDAVTRYRTLEWIGPYSLVSLKPEHGRKHQLRRHMATFGHAIVGDDRHGGAHASPRPPRLCLHARVLQIGEQPAIACELPADLEGYLERLRARFNEPTDNASEAK